LAQAAPGVLPAASPPPPAGTGYFAIGPSTPLQQALGNYVASPVNTIRTADGGTVTIGYRFGMPVIFTHPYVPTDMAGVGGGLGHARGLRHELLGPDRNTLPDSHGIIVARDPRYSFTGRWHPINWGAARVAAVPTVRTLSAVMQPRELAAVPPAVPVVVADQAPAAVGRFRDIDATRVSALPQFMPTADAQYVINPGNEVQLSSGALLIKSGTGSPVYVSTNINNQALTVRLAKGTLALVSVLDGRLTVGNLSDIGQDSVVVYLGDSSRCDYGYSPVRVGHLAEVYPTALGCGANDLVAYSVHTRVPLTNGLTFESMRLSYPRALKRFNLTRALCDADLRQVIKTAAAVSYLDREREWNGLQPYAP
jgi:hypothetical protein